MNRRKAVILLNLGGPDSLIAIEPFLYNLFSDPDIFHIPFGQKLFAKIISKLRAPKVAKLYEQIGSRSPITELTEKQRGALESELKEFGVDVFFAMRYWHPLSEEIVRIIEKEDYEEIILLSLYPHYSIVTVGSSVNEWFRHFKGDKERVKIISSYFDNKEYWASVSDRIDETLKEFKKVSKEEVFILFSAHSTPQSVIDKGDPYQKQIIESVKGIMNLRNNENSYGISYQSKVGPVKWLEPSTENYIKELGEKGIKNVLVVPISFVSEHLETLYELGIEYRKVAIENGVENYRVMKALNDSPLFIKTLKNIVIDAL